ncbi:MAG: ADP-ribosylglycohydrolase family protein [Nanoarchaeota archaeon]
MTEFQDKYVGTLIGCALGDTLGMPVEAWSKARIEKYAGKISFPIAPIIVRDDKKEIVYKDEFGKIRYFNIGLTTGDYTDDTILTLALAESIAAKQGLDLEDIAQRQLYEYTSRIQADGTIAGGFGGTTRQGFKRLMQGISPLESGVIGGPGNAPAMKMSPVGLYMDATGNSEQGLEYAELIGKITHLDPRSIASGVIQAHSIYVLLQEISKNEFVESIVRVSSSWEKPVPANYSAAQAGNLTSRLNWIEQNKNVRDEEAHTVLGSGSSVLCSYPFALFMFQKYWDEPLTGLIETINWGGDCDTTGAMYGALCGAKNGMIFPEEWLAVLKNKEKIEKAGKGVYQIKTDKVKS